MVALATPPSLIPLAFFRDFACPPSEPDWRFRSTEAQTKSHSFWRRCCRQWLSSPNCQWAMTSDFIAAQPRGERRAILARALSLFGSFARRIQACASRNKYALAASGVISSVSAKKSAGKKGICRRLMSRPPRPRKLHPISARGNRARTSRDREDSRLQACRHADLEKFRCL
jgi:hypothetical protein